MSKKCPKEDAAPAEPVEGEKPEPVKPKRPRDVTQIAAELVAEATGEKEARDPDEGKDPAAVRLGRKGGKKGGKARAEKMTAEERSEAARKAAEARWAKDPGGPSKD